MKAHRCLIATLILAGLAIAILLSVIAESTSVREAEMGTTHEPPDKISMPSLADMEYRGVPTYATAFTSDGKTFHIWTNALSYLQFSEIRVFLVGSSREDLFGCIRQVEVRSPTIGGRSPSRSIEFRTIDDVLGKHRFDRFVVRSDRCFGPNEDHSKLLTLGTHSVQARVVLRRTNEEVLLSLPPLKIVSTEDNRSTRK